MVRAVAVDTPVTATGVVELMTVPLPSWPELLSPQHRTVPSASSAQELPASPATLDAVVIPLTVTGPDQLLAVPSPS